MRIKSIEIEGFKDKKRKVILEFPDTPITILYGDNGSGKTTLLRVLSALFSMDEAVLISENIRRIEIELEANNESKKYIIERKSEEQFQIEINFDNEEVLYRYSWGNFPQDIRTLLFGVNRGVSHNIAVQPAQIERFFHSAIGERYRRSMRVMSISNFAEDLSIYLQKMDVNRMRIQGRYKKAEELYKRNANIEELDMGTIEYLLKERYDLAEKKKKARVQNALFSTLSHAVYKGDEKLKMPIEIENEEFEAWLASYRIKLLDVINDMEENELQRKLAEILSNEDINIILRECKDNELFLTLMINMMRELDEEEEILESISSIRRIFNAHIIKNKELIIDKNGVRIEFVGNSDSHNLANLSSGERHLLSFLTICVLNGQSRDIVMIDEPELSLNGKWKKTILDELQKLLPNTQIVVATHSSTIVNGKYNALARLV